MILSSEVSSSRSNAVVDQKDRLVPTPKRFLKTSKSNIMFIVLACISCLDLFSKVYMTSSIKNTNVDHVLSPPPPPHRATRSITKVRGMLLNQEAGGEKWMPADESKRTLHMIYCLFGDDVNFMDEWEVSYKSVIFNAPLDANMHVHIICNHDGSLAAEERIKKTGLLGSDHWRNEIVTTVTILSKSKEENLLDFLRGMLLNQEAGGEKWMDPRLGLGAFLRLFAYKYILEYLPKTAENDLDMAYYLDVDVIILSNLNNVMTMTDNMWSLVKEKETPTPLWFWGHRNSGFLGINVPKFDTFWKSVSQCKSIKEDSWPQKNDQWLLQHVSKCFSKIYSEQPANSPWSVHMGHGYRRRPQDLSQRSSVGMVHLQLPSDTKWFDMSTKDSSKSYVDKFCQRSKGCSETDVEKDLKLVRRTWGMASYFVDLSWDWLLFQSGESRVAPSESGNFFTLMIREGFSNFTLNDFLNFTLNEYI